MYVVKWMKYAAVETASATAVSIKPAATTKNYIIQILRNVAAAR
jgi:hypothetical protein